MRRDPYYRGNSIRFRLRSNSIWTIKKKNRKTSTTTFRRLATVHLKRLYARTCCAFDAPRMSSIRRQRRNTQVVQYTEHGFVYANGLYVCIVKKRFIRPKSRSVVHFIIGSRRIIIMERLMDVHATNGVSYGDALLNVFLFTRAHVF